MADPRDAEKQDVETLKRRGRRRLVGAIALVLAAVIVLPMVFDAEPRRAPPVSVRIPSEDDPAFTPKVVPKAPVAKPEASVKGQPAPAPEAKSPEKPEAKPEARGPAKPEAKAESKPESKAEAKAVTAPPAEAERRRAEAALAGEQFFVPVGAFSNAEKLQEVIERLAAAKIPHYTEQIAIAKGTATRVRAGPFQTPEAAEQALRKLQGLGYKPGKVTPRS